MLNVYNYMQLQMTNLCTHIQDCDTLSLYFKVIKWLQQKNCVTYGLNEITGNK